MGITEETKEEIRRRYADGMFMYEIAKLMGIPESTVRNIIMREDQKVKK